jgi:hypothetical protein
VGWAFGGEEEELAEKWKAIPLFANIVITHGPPAGKKKII